MTNVYDDYYEKVSKESFSKDDLLNILENLSKIHSFGKNYYTAFDLCLKMSESSNVDDEVIKELVKYSLSKFNADQLNMEYLIVDNGSKKLFDELWENGMPPENFPMKFWKSKHSSSKQLEEIYKDQLTPTKNKFVDKQWLNKERQQFFKHPNAPTKILSRNLKKIDNLIAMASNPNLTNKSKIFDAVCEASLKVQLRDKKPDLILENLLINRNLEWSKVANAINIKKQIKDIINDSPFMKPTRRIIILSFCKRKECPDEIKGMLYTHTGDDSFLPQTVKDVFLF